MSATGPYQSKLFNFLNRQSIQWGNRLTQTARRLKITAEWGTQVALYPLYLLVQSGRVAVRQIAATQAERKRLALAEATKTQGSDSALPVALNPAESESAMTMPLQGLACDLVTQDILFVDQDNHTVQPSQPQSELNRKISFHLGSANYEKKQQYLASQPVNPRVLPPINGHRARLLTPLRWVLQGLSWLEQSPVAIAIDLFGESRWHTAIVPPEIYSPQLLPPLPLGPLLQPVDQRIAKLEQALLTPTKTPEDLPPLKRFLRRFIKLADTTTAITTTAAQESPTPSPKPWLTWTDIFREKATAQAEEPVNPDPASSEASLIPSFLDELGQQTESGDLVPPATTAPEAIAATQAQSQDLTTVGSAPNSTNIEARPEWIETEALSIGYEQHFLERLLKAVDHLLAWLENTTTKILQKFNVVKK